MGSREGIKVTNGRERLVIRRFQAPEIIPGQVGTLSYSKS